MIKRNCRFRVFVVQFQTKSLLLKVIQDDEAAERVYFLLVSTLGAGNSLELLLWLGQVGLPEHSGF